MSKTILKRSLASTLSFLMAFSSAVPNSAVYAEESGIESEIAQDYTATLSQTQNGTTSFVTDGNKTKDPATHAQGDKVEVAVEPDEGFNTAEIEVKNTDGTVVASLEDGKVTADDEGNYTFEMPASDVTIGASFEAVKKETADAETETAGSKTETEKKGTEEVKEKVKANVFDEFNKDSLVSKKVVDQYDFSSREIIIATEKADTIVDKDDIVDSGNGMYVLRYATAEHAKNAYSYYYGKAGFVAPNIAVHAAEGETSEDAGPADVGAPLNTLEQLGDAKKNARGTVIAVVDSGMPSNGNVTNRVSVINGGTEVGDDNGHGTKTMDAILSVNPNAKILSIKALDADGHGDAASIYAGIEYAKNSGAKIIVLPLYAYSVGENAALSKVINEAIAKGITVVGAAGNDGANVKYYVPGNIDAAYIVGAANENGEKIASSNYGSTVDYNVIAESTSEASAKFAGFLSTVKGSYPAALEKAADEQTLIFRTDEVKKPEEEKNNSETADEVIAKYKADLSKKAIVRYTFVDESLLVSGDNWDSIMNGDREKIITTTLAETNLYKAEDGTYPFNANTPWANGVASGKVVDYVFAKGNDKGEFVTKGVSFNKDTHVASVTDAALKAAEGDFSNIQMQVIVPTNLSKTSNIGLTIESKNNNPVNTEFTASLFDYPSFAMHLKGTDGTLSKDDLTVYVNGEKTSKDGFEFNSKSNIVTVKSYAIGISKIRVVIDKDVKVTFDKAIADGAKTLPNAVAFYLKDGTDVSRLNVGTTTTVDAVYGNSGYPARPEPYSKLGSEYIGIVQSDTSKDYDTKVLGYLGFPKNLFGIDFQFYNSSGSSMGSWVDGKRGEINSSNIGIAAYCTHEKTEIKPGANKETKFKIINKYKVGSETEFVMAYETTTGSAAAGYGASQNLGGVIKFRVKDNNPNVKIVKKSSNEAITNGSACYSLEGTTYELRNGSTVVATFTLDADGNSTSKAVPAGNYTLVETKAGKGYKLSDPISVTVNQTEKEQTFNVTDEPGGDPFVISMAKAPLNGGTGNYPSTAGAEFTVKYYDGFYSSKGELPNTPKYTWKYVSKAYTGTKLSKETSIVDFSSASYLAANSSRDGLFIREDGDSIDIPYGTVTIEETKSPASYLLNPSYVDADGTARDELILNVNYDDNNAITFAGTNTSATKIQGELEADSITTLTKEIMAPVIETNLTADNGTHFTEATSEVRLVDGVTLKNCESLAALGKKVRVTGQLHDVETGKLVTLENGKTSVTTDITVDEKTEKVNNAFVFDATKYKGHTLVATEAVTMDGKELVKHDNLKDEAQMVHFPKIGTTNVGKESQRHIANIYGDIVLEDTVNYENLQPNTTYTVNGKLMDQKTGKPVLDENGKEVTASTTFTTGAATDDNGQTLTGYDEHSVPQYSGEHKVTVSGTTKVTFKFKSSKAAKEAAQKYVAYENIPGYATHADIDDEAQTVYFPHVDTIASNNKNNSSSNYHGYNTIAMELAGDVKIKDKVAVTGVSPDAGTLRLDAYLYDVKTGKQLYNADGTPVTGTKTFTADNSGNATETVYLNTIDAKNLQFKDGTKYNAKGKTVVVYEYLYSENVGVGLEAELTSTDQSVIFPSAHTTATDEGTKDHYASSVGVRKIKDVVDFTGLLPDKTYHIKGELKNKKTGEAITDNDGNPIVVEGDFVTTDGDPVKEVKRGENVIGSIGPVKIPSAGADVSKRHLVDGNVAVTFNVPTEKLQGATTVAFETISIDGLEVITHADINDEAQTDYFPGGHTTLTDSETEDHIANADKSVKLTDVVSYTNLKPETEFTVTGTLMDRATKKAVVDADGKEVTSTVKFTTPAAAEGKKTVSGKVEVEFKFNASSLGNHTVVAFERMWRNDLKTDVLMWQHEDYNDKAQTVYFPEGKTTINDKDTGNHITSEVLKDITLVDHVYYSNLLPGKEYTVNGTLMDKGTGKPFVDKDGKEVTASTTFTAPNAKEGEDTVSGVVDVTFKFKGGDYLAGKTLVAFETCKYEGKDVFVHEKINDAPQTTYVPAGHTNLVDNATKDHIAGITEKMSLTDTVYYENLKSGKTYKVTGVLMDRDTGKPFISNGKKVEATKEFTIDPEPIVDANGEEVKDQNGTTMMAPVSGSVDLTFEFEGSDELKGKTLVAFETMAYKHISAGKEVEIFVHKDLKDEAQTVHIPGGRTNVVDKDTKDRISKADKDVTLIDTVTYSNLLAGKEYEVTGTLMNKETGEPLLVNGKEVKSTVKFTAPTPEDGSKYVSGTVDVTFKFDGSALAGKAVVAFEKVTYKGITVFTHADINDNDQTDYFPDGHTTITDNNTKDQITYAQGEISITDTVHYEGLLAEREYEVTGVLHDKKTGKPLKVDGKEVTASTKFTTPAAKEGKETVDGTVDVTFKFAGSKGLEDSEFVAFETATRNGAEVFVHADINDVAQTVTVPGGRTTATDSETGNHTSYADKDVTIVDRVEYEGLLPEKEYKVEGKLMNKETGKPILVDGKEVTATAKFTTPKAEDEGLRVSGHVDVTFKFDGRALAGTAAVVFENVYYNGVKVFTHADLEDEAQTVEFPGVKTSVKDAADNDRKITAKGTATMIDTVTYTNLVPGKSYTLKGVIMDKATGKPLTIDGKEVTASTTFVPEKKNGTAEVTFKFDASKVKPGNYVVFETMMETETKVVVGSHEDLNDKDQTFIVEAVPKHPKTGDRTNIFGWGAIAFGSLAVGLSLVFKRKKKEEDAQ